MEEDEKPAKLMTPLGALLVQDLETQSVAELEQRILKLKQEITRVEQVIQSKKSVMGAAHGLFKS